MTVIEERDVTPSDGYTLRGTRDGNGISVDVTHVYVRRSNIGSLNFAVCRVEGFANIYASYSLPTKSVCILDREGVWWTHPPIPWGNRIVC